MKNSICSLSLMIAIFNFILTGCQKNNEPTANENDSATASILGKWNIVNKSATLTFKGNEIFSSKYTGALTDYYEFRNDGRIYMMQGKTTRSMEYKTINNFVIIFFDKMYIDTLQLIKLDFHELELLSTKLYSNEQSYIRAEKLKR